MPADGLAPLDARISAGIIFDLTMMTKFVTLEAQIITNNDTAGMVIPKHFR